MGALIMYAFVIIIAVTAGIYYIREDKKAKSKQHNISKRPTCHSLTKVGLFLYIRGLPKGIRKNKKCIRTLRPDAPEII